MKQAELIATYQDGSSIRLGRYNVRKAYMLADIMQLNYAGVTFTVKEVAA